MPSAFDNLFQSAAFGHHQMHFGEPIVYKFRAGGRRAIDAIINRDPPAFYSPAGDIIKANFIIRVDNDCRTGVLSSEVDSNQKVELLAELGDIKPTEVTVLVLKSQDSGVCVIALK